MAEQSPSTQFKPKKSVALSGVAAGNTAICTVGRSGKDLHYRGYNIYDLAEHCEFEEVAYLLIYGALPTSAQLKAYKNKLKSLRGLPAAVRRCCNNCPPLHIPWMCCARLFPPWAALCRKRTTTVWPVHATLPISCLHRYLRH